MFLRQSSPPAVAKLGRRVAVVVAVVVVVIVASCKVGESEITHAQGDGEGLLSVGSLWGGETGGTGRGWRSVLAVRLEREGAQPVGGLSWRLR